jgi:hypothetical protein
VIKSKLKPWQVSEAYAFEDDPPLPDSLQLTDQECRLVLSRRATHSPYQFLDMALAELDLGFAGLPHRDADTRAEVRLVIHSIKNIIARVKAALEHHKSKPHKAK